MSILLSVHLSLWFSHRNRLHSSLARSIPPPPLSRLFVSLQYDTFLSSQEAKALEACHPSWLVEIGTALEAEEAGQEGVPTDENRRGPSAAWLSWFEGLHFDEVGFACMPFDRSDLEVLRGGTMSAEFWKHAERVLKDSFPDMPSMLGEEGGSGAALVPFAASAAVVSDGSGGDGKVGEDEGDVLSKNAAKKVEEKDDDEAQEVRKSREA